MSVLGPDGKPASVDRVLVPELPAWCHGVKYRAEDDIITVLVHVPASKLANEHILAMECEVEHAEALIDALQKCVTRSRETERVVDVPTGPVS